MANPAEVVAMARRVFPDKKRAMNQVEEAKAQLEQGGGLEAAGLESLRPPGGATELEAEIFGVPRTDTLDKRLADGRAGLAKAMKGNTKLTPSEQLGLEAIVLLFGRPALLVQDGDFGTPPPEWTSLEDKRVMLKEMIPSVGRVELEGHHSFPWCGTAFLIGDGILMTNRHVALIFAQQSAKEWKFMSGVTARVDYKEEYQRDTSNEFKIDKVLDVHPDFDLALLSVSMKAGKGKKSPKPLKVSSKVPKVTKDGDVAVIGYPAFDSRNGQKEQIEIFKNIFNVKRLLPGKSTGLAQPTVLGHDASTLGGNSGSCVVDLDKGEIIGLHYGGQYLKGNVSVPLWTLTNDKVLKKYAINWA